MLITLTTDFGYRDAFVGIMKGVIHRINPQALIVDLTHGIDKQDVVAGALLLRHSVDYFPAGTIHVAIIDPGVGSERKPLVVEADGSFFVGPDNGIWSLALEEREVSRIIHLTNGDFHLKPTSATFHGRDIFAPVAAHLSLGINPECLGSAVDGFLRLLVPGVESRDEGAIGEIIYIDDFGNLFTNIRQHDLKNLPTDRMTITIGDISLASVSSSYTAVPEGDWVAIWNSWGLLEIAANRNNAQQRSGAKVGDQVCVGRRD